jgi:hypothetical protein
MYLFVYIYNILYDCFEFISSCFILEPHHPADPGRANFGLFFLGFGSFFLPFFWSRIGDSGAKSRKKMWARHTATLCELRYTYNMLVLKSKGKRVSGKPQT